MSDDEIGFCQFCGAKLKDGAEFCTSCGKQVSRHNGQNNSHGRTRSDDYLLWATIFVGLYAVIGIIGGLVSVLSADWMVQTMESFFTPEGWANFLNSMGLSSSAEFKSYTITEGAVALVSALIAAVSTVLCSMRKYWESAVGSCAIAAVVLFVSLAMIPSSAVSYNISSVVIQFVIGIIVAYVIYKAKPSFTE